MNLRFSICKKYLCERRLIMKILFYSNTVFSFGGVQRVLAEIAKSLSKTHDVTILTIDTGKDFSMYGYDQSAVKFDFISYPSRKGVENLICKGYSFFYKKWLPHNRYTSAVYAHSFFLPTYKRKLVAKVNAGGYDVVIGVHAYLSLHLAAVRKRIHAKTVLGWMHNSYEAFFEKENPYLPHLKDFFAYEMAELDKIVVLSHTDKKKYEERLGLRSEMIYNPLTVEVKGRADLSNKRFLSIGRFSKGHKGFDLLIKAFAQFAEKNAEWMLDIVGEGTEEEVYRSLIKANNLENRISIHPFTKDIHQYYARSSVYVLASRWEGMPLVLMEAMAYGLPIVASDIPIATELLEGEGMAMLFERENIRQLADGLNSMATEADLNRMSEKSIAYAEKFKIDAIIKQWEKILN